MPAVDAKKMKYKRLIFKISGEILGSQTQIFKPKSIEYITRQIFSIHSLGIKFGIVIGGGNIIRGREIDAFDKINADLCGMIGTMINGIVISSYLKKKNVNVSILSSIEVNGIFRKFNKFEDLKNYESGDILVFVGGTGNPLFTTDTAAALRAVELGADIFIKGTKVDGVYSADPITHSDAKFYQRLDYDEAITKNLAVMDLTAFNICKEAKIPICVYNVMKYPLEKIILGEEIGTLITGR